MQGVGLSLRFINLTPTAPPSPPQGRIALPRWVHVGNLPLSSGTQTTFTFVLSHQVRISQDGLFML